MTWMGLKYYISYYKNWIISFFIFSALFLVTIFLSFEWSFRLLESETTKSTLLGESIEHTLFIYATALLLGLVLVTFVRLFGFFRKNEVQQLLEKTTEKLKQENIALSQENFKLKTILKNQELGVFIVKKGRVGFANSFMEDLWGEKYRLYKNKTANEMFFKSLFNPVYQNCLERAKKNKKHTETVLLYTKSGKIQPFSITSLPFKYGQELRYIAFLVKSKEEHFKNDEWQKITDNFIQALAILRNANISETEAEILLKTLHSIKEIFNFSAMVWKVEDEERLHFIGGCNQVESTVPAVSELHVSGRRFSCLSLIKSIRNRTIVTQFDRAENLSYKKYFFPEYTFFSTHAFPIFIDNKIEFVFNFFCDTPYGIPELIAKSFQILFNEIGRSFSDKRLNQFTQEAIRRYEQQQQEQIVELEKDKQVMKQQASDVNAIIRDLIVARDAAEAANKTKTDFLANISHELRTPLNAILGFAETIAAETFGAIQNEKYVEYIKYISVSGHHLLSLINDILDLSRAEAGKQILVDEPINLRDLIDELWPVILQYPGGKKRVITINISDKKLGLNADKRSLKQILLNLLSNAIKFTKEGDSITLQAQHTSTGNLEILVEDSGVGIPKNKMAELFQPFVQIENIMTRTHEGSGLGLALVKKLVQLHHGNVWLDENVTKGTIVHLEFPAERVIKIKPEGNHEKV